jgi:hypothetical protein
VATRQTTQKATQPVPASIRHEAAIEAKSPVFTGPCRLLSDAVGHSHNCLNAPPGFERTHENVDGSPISEHGNAPNDAPGDEIAALLNKLQSLPADARRRLLNNLDRQ